MKTSVALTGNSWYTLFMVILIALLTVLSWGLWLIPSQKVPLKSQHVKTFFVAGANLVLALGAALWMGSVTMPLTVFGPPFIGGLIWSLGGLGAFTATDRIGISKAFGIWAPLNIVVGMAWGALLFGEFPVGNLMGVLALVGAGAVVIVGVLTIIFAKGAGEGKTDSRAGLGFLAAIAAGIFWGTYFVPIKASSVSLWTAAWPMALGMFVGSAALLLTAPKGALRLAKPTDALRLGSTGLLWGLGNYGSLMLVDQLGASRGFTIAQVSIVVASLVSILVLKDPPPRSKAAVLTLAGCVLVTAGGIALGTVR